ncbi:hypothetical protein [Gloeothece verrucosa]|uniref:Glycogen debranching enzyme n=1 Tax=Gloeothece verrucosa (strain PCC 7822) TaxID=497965 RepID=E0UH63_GLOV7|nr:hypothetical protein [Gloeothece verrucosa]ADN15662.1 glycogen debranching enzyme [Gloeothece verrucosa PCC 7822]
MKIWVNEQIDPGGIIYSCIASCNEQAAMDCHQTWLKSLTDQQKEEGWVVQIRTVDSWEDVPVNALKISY